MPDNSQKLQLIQAIRQSGFPGSATDVFSAYDQGRDLIGEFVAQQQQQQEQQEQQQSQQQGNQGMAQGGPPQPPPMNRPDGRVSQPNVNQPVDNNQGHLVQAGDTQNVGIQDLPTGPAQSQMIQARKGGVKKYRAGGIKKSKPYISKYPDGGVRSNDPVDEEDMSISPLTAMQSDYQNYSSSRSGGDDGNLMPFSEYERLYPSIGKFHLGNSNYNKKGSGTVGFNSDYASNFNDLGYDPYTGKIAPISQLKSKYKGKDYENHNFNTFNPDFMPGSAIGEWNEDAGESTSTGGINVVDNNATNINDETFNNLDAEDHTYQESQDKSKYMKWGKREQNRFNQFGDRWNNSINTNSQTFKNSSISDELTGFKGEGWRDDLYNPIVGQGTGADGNIFLKDKNGNRIKPMYNSDGTYSGNLNEALSYSSDHTTPFMQSMNKISGTVDDAMSVGTIAGSTLVGAGAYSNLGKIGKLSADTGFAAYGANNLKNQYQNPEKYGDLGLNLNTSLNVLSTLPFLNRTRKLIPKNSLIKNSLKYTANNVLKGGREVVTGAKTPFTTMPLRQTVGYTPSNKFSNVLDRVKNTSIGRTFSNNVEKTYKGVNQFFNPNKTPITSPIMKRFGTNQKMVTKFNSGPQTGYYGNLNRSTPGVSYPAGSINNTFGNVTNSIKGGINAAYYGTKVYGAKKGLEAVYNHSTAPSNWNNLESNLNFGTDLANTVFGGEKVADLTKIGTYTGLGKYNKAITQAVGMFPFLKPFANVNKINNKTKLQVNPNATSIVSK